MSNFNATNEAPLPYGWSVLALAFFIRPRLQPADLLLLVPDLIFSTFLSIPIGSRNSPPRTAAITTSTRTSPTLPPSGTTPDRTNTYSLSSRSKNSVATNSRISDSTLKALTSSLRSINKARFSNPSTVRMVRVKCRRGSSQTPPRRRRRLLKVCTAFLLPSLALFHISNQRVVLTLRLPSFAFLPSCLHRPRVW